MAFASGTSINGLSALNHLICLVCFGAPLLSCFFAFTDQWPKPGEGLPLLTALCRQQRPIDQL